MNRHKPAHPQPDPADPRRLCGCGLSPTFPYCDGSQLISRSRDRGKLVSCGAGEEVAHAQPQEATAKS